LAAGDSAGPVPPDLLGGVRWLIDHQRIEGAVNLSSPHPLPNAECMRVLREAWGIRVGLPATRWMLKLGAMFMGTDMELVLKSRRVVPRRLLDDGFVFNYPHWPEAARDLCERWKRASGAANASVRE
jgi:uncharacterized protein